MNNAIVKRALAMMISRNSACFRLSAHRTTIKATRPNLRMTKEVATPDRSLGSRARNAPNAIVYEIPA